MTATDETQAAEPIDATEPAPSQAETESIYAWSEHSEDDTELIQRRSWKLPIALTALTAAAAITTGVVMLWPAKKTPPPAQTPPAAAAPAPTAPELALTPGDKMFLDSITSYGFHPRQKADAIAVGRATCELLKMGNSLPDTVDLIAPKLPGVAGPGVTVFVNDAVTAYCPQYAN